jgi:hypothetical protein
MLCPQQINNFSSTFVYSLIYAESILSMRSLYIPFEIRGCIKKEKKKKAQGGIVHIASCYISKVINKIQLPEVTTSLSCQMFNTERASMCHSVIYLGKSKRVSQAVYQLID